jgi:hypothetical protein
MDHFSLWMMMIMMAVLPIMATESKRRQSAKEGLQEN